MDRLSSLCERNGKVVRWAEKNANVSGPHGPMLEVLLSFPDERDLGQRKSDIVVKG